MLRTGHCGFHSFTVFPKVRAHSKLRQLTYRDKNTVRVLGEKNLQDSQKYKNVFQESKWEKRGIG